MTDPENPNNMARACPSLDEALFARRRAAIYETLALLEDGEADAALRRITSSVLGEQARLAGIRVVPL